MVLRLSFIIPLYNEEGCLNKNFETIKAYLDTLKKPYEIILVDDGSTDNTASIIEEIFEFTFWCFSSLNFSKA